MNISDLKNRRVGIIGFGKEGQAVLKFLSDNQITASVFDRTEQNQLSAEAKHMLATSGAQYFGGENYLESATEECELWFKSPGVLLPKEILETAHSKEIILTSQTAWFFEHCPAKIIGITGTKGKGTTSSLIHEMLLAAGHQSFLTGNIGLASAFDVLSKASEKDFVVFEMSSFQLEYLERSPNIGVCLMVTNDHFDYHNSKIEYWNAKAAIAKYQSSHDALFFNGDYDGSRKISTLGTAKKFAISKDFSQHPQIYIDETHQSITLKITDQTLVVDASNRKLLGNHNLENIAAASAVAAYVGIEKQTIEQVVKTFHGLPHRLQIVGTYNGITFIDDSIATNPDTTIAALNAISEPTILLLGGADKQLDYTELLNHLASAGHLKKIVLIGEVGKILGELAATHSLDSKVTGPYSDFESAMEEVFKLSVAGDIVLLSPAATSFDMFKNYSERGDRFSRLAKEHYV